MKFLVLGASGMAGHTISLYLLENGHDVTGFDLKKASHCKSVIGDARNTEQIKNIIETGSFDSVINCVGILNQFAEQNKELAVYLNSYLPHYLAMITADTETQIIHMSTDCVFSGDRGSYTEGDLRDGTTFYDRTKALGELEDDKNITLRNSIIGPDINPNGIGLLNWFMQQTGRVNGFTKAMWTGVTSLQLAKAMEVAAREKAHGLYNMVYKEAISKHDLIGLINHHIRGDAITIVPFDTFVADKSLKRTRFEFGFSIPDYETMIIELAEWITDHKDMYPHYHL